MGHLSVIGSRVIRSRSRVIDGSRLVVDGSGFVSGCRWVIRSGLVSGYWCDIRSWLVDGSWVVRSGLVDGFGVIRSGSRCVIRNDLTFVFHISNVSVFVVSSVSDNLGSAIGKGNTVFTSDNTVIILGFLFGEISTRVFVFDTIFIGERPGGQFVFGCWVVWGGLVNGFWVVRSGCRGVVRSWGRVVRGGVIRGMISHSHSHERGQQHFAQHDVIFFEKLNK